MKRETCVRVREDKVEGNTIFYWNEGGNREVGRSMTDGYKRISDDYLTVVLSCFHTSGASRDVNPHMILDLYRLQPIASLQ